MKIKKSFRVYYFKLAEGTKGRWIEWKILPDGLTLKIGLHNWIYRKL